jgi:VWFA-related protein
MHNLLCSSSLMVWLAVCSQHAAACAVTNQDAFDGASNTTYHSRPSEVRLVFFATDEQNRPVEQLRQDDFAIVDNEHVIRTFRSFSRAPLGRLDIAVLIDSSESVHPQFAAEMASLLQLMSQWPSNPDHNLSILSVSGMEPRFVCTSDCWALSAGWFTAIQQGGATPLFDALQLAAVFLAQRQQPDTWPLIILFSDGRDTISKSSFRGALEKVLAAGVQIYSIDLNPPRQMDNGSAILQEFAKDTGGRYIQHGPHTTKTMGDILDDLHSARLVTYALPESSSAFHSIRILPTHNPNLQFRSRRGYYREPPIAH